MPSAVVLDPMVGSGTTAVAARRLGRRALGVERDPLALLIARCATRSFEFEEILAVSDRVLKRARVLARRGEAQQAGRGATRFIKYWFPVASRRHLAALAGAIREEPGDADRDLAWMVFSSLIIAKSAGASWAMDISRSRPHKRKDKGFVLPFDAWSQRCATVAARLPFRDRAATYHGMNANPHLRVKVSAAIRDDEVLRLYPRRSNSVGKGNLST